MLGDWRCHEDYLSWMTQRFQNAVQHNVNAVKEYSTAFQKVFRLNLDLIWEYFVAAFAPCFRGRPSHRQPEIFRSFVLMVHFKYTSIDKWVQHASATAEICILVGVEPEDYPGASTHRDFYNRLWQGKKTNKRKEIIEKPVGDYGNKKQPPKNPGIIDELAKKAIGGETFDDIPEKFLLAIFMQSAVVPSAEQGLLGDTGNLTIAADGSCVYSHSNPRGHRVLDEDGAVIQNLRQYADPDAVWGWDSYHKCWFYGYTAYLICIHNSDYNLDLPLYMRFEGANAFDGVTFIKALAHFRSLSSSMEFLIKNAAADSAHDNLPTYRLLKELEISAFIDLNPRSAKMDSTKKDNTANTDELPVITVAAGLKPAKSTIEDGVPLSSRVLPAPNQKPLIPILNATAPGLPADMKLSSNIRPVCRAGVEMTYGGFDKQRCRCKFRCPEVTGEIGWCKCYEECSKTDYGRTVYLKTDDDPRLFPDVPRASEQWKKVYNNRTAAERVNNRILTDYELEHSKRYGKAKLCFFGFCAAINIHLDAQIKVENHSIGKAA